MRATLGLLTSTALLAAGCGGSGTESASSTDNAATEAASTTGGCREVEAPEPRRDGGQKRPVGRLDLRTTYRLDFTTSCGRFTVTLAQELAPATAASLVSLARDGYFDDTVFHRIVPGFVIQGGDPTQTGSGGPGYQTVDTPPADAGYVKGVVAMAKTQAEAPGTSGSQFFVVTGEDVGLPPDYAIVGEVTGGLDVVERIGKLGDASEQPTQTVLIEQVTVTEES